MQLLSQSPAYETSADLATGTSGVASSQVKTFTSGEGAAEQLVMEKLGVHGWGRWQYFRNSFSQKWGNEDTVPLQPRSQTTFLSALKLLEFPEGKPPSLFLTNEGTLELAWEDASGSPIQIEFGTNQTELYFESRGIEQSIPNASLPAFLECHIGDKC